MKVAKGLAFFLFFAILLGSCFNPPEFSVEPKIGLVDIVYFKKPKISRDSLMIQIKFNDGDGDLGLDPESDEHQEAPYNAANYFQSNSAGELVPTTASILHVPYYNKDNGNRLEDRALELLNVPSANDELATYHLKRANSMYSNLPEIDPNCSRNYEPRKQFAIRYANRRALSPFAKIDTVIRIDTVKYIVATDTIYFTLNPNHYNYDLSFLIQSGNQYVEYDLWALKCTTANGRFPVLSEKTNTAIEGTLTYGVTNSRGFSAIFHDNLMKIRVTIRDRQLHNSNTIESDPFTLSSIKDPKGG